jgi:hypothetical protein
MWNPIPFTHLRNAGAFNGNLRARSHMATPIAASPTSTIAQSDWTCRRHSRAIAFLPKSMALQIRRNGSSRPMIEEWRPTL